MIKKIVFLVRHGNFRPHECPVDGFFRARKSMPKTIIHPVRARTMPFIEDAQTAFLSGMEINGEKKNCVFTYPDWVMNYTLFIILDLSIRLFLSNPKMIRREHPHGIGNEFFHFFLALLNLPLLSLSIFSVAY